MSKTTIPTGGITADAIDSTLIADDAVSEEHLDNTALTGFSELTALADADKFLISDASDSNNIKYVQKSNMPSGIYNLVTSFSPSSEGSSITVDNCFTSTYDKYFITFEKLRNGNANSRIDMYLRVGGSSGSDAGTNHGGAYHGNIHNNTEKAGSTANSLQGTMIQGVYNDTYYHGHAFVFYPTTTSINTTFMGKVVYRDGGSSYAGYSDFGYIDLGSQAHTGFVIQSSSGNFNTTAVRFNVYGITNGA